MRRVDEGQRCEVERCERQDKIVSEDMLRDKGALRLRGEEKCFKLERLCKV